MAFDEDGMSKGDASHISFSDFEPGRFSPDQMPEYLLGGTARYVRGKPFSGLHSALKINTLDPLQYNAFWNALRESGGYLIPDMYNTHTPIGDWAVTKEKWSRTERFMGTARQGLNYNLPDDINAVREAEQNSRLLGAEAAGIEKIEGNIGEIQERMARAGHTFTQADIIKFFESEGKFYTDKIAGTSKTGRLGSLTNMRRMVRQRATELEQASQDNFYWRALDQLGGKIQPDLHLNIQTGRWSRAGEFKDIPRHLMRNPQITDEGRAISGKIFGNIDELTSMVNDSLGQDMSTSDALDFFANNTRNKRRAYLNQAAEEMGINWEDIRPKSVPKITISTQEAANNIEHIMSETDWAKYGKIGVGVGVAVGALAAAGYANARIQSAKMAYENRSDRKKHPYRSTRSINQHGIFG